MARLVITGPGTGDCKLVCGFCGQQEHGSLPCVFPLVVKDNPTVDRKTVEAKAAP